MVSRLRIGLKSGLPAIIKTEDRFKTIAVFGMPGVGKSVLTINFFQQDCYARTAKILIDPSGSLAKDAFSLSGGYYCSKDTPIGINPLMGPYDPDDIADNVIECINQVVRLSTENVQLTVRMRSALREAIVWCVERNQRRLDAVVDYLSCKSKVHQETKIGLIDRLNMFIQDKRLFQILCEAEPISWRDIIRNGKTFILDCHGFSEDKMRFLGTLVTHGIKSYLRYSKEEKYYPLALYVDECHNFINPNFFTILKEGRKYKIATFLATQDFTSMPSNLVSVILSNSGTLISFRTGFKEASLLSREFPTISTADLQNLPKYHCAYRTPEDEGIVKASRPPFIRKKTPESKKIDRRSFELKWFTPHRASSQ